MLNCFTHGHFQSSTPSKEGADILVVQPLRHGYVGTEVQLTGTTNCSRSLIFFDDLDQVLDTVQEYGLTLGMVSGHYFRPMKISLSREVYMSTRMEILLILF